jgi:RNA polymerase sigma factor (TIGR02999 family)
MDNGSSRAITQALAKWNDGDENALRGVLPLVYDELRKLAHHYPQGERADDTLQSTALVREAYLRLIDQKSFHPQNRAHFIAMVYRLMREILVDYARQHRAAKRDYTCKIELDEAIGLSQKREFDLLALDRALEKLTQFDPQQGRIVEVRFFGGLSIEETSQALGVSPATVKREWATVRAWLYREMADPSMA